MNKLLSLGCQISPGFRGALYYGGYFAAFGIIVPFLNVHFLELGLDGRQIGILAMLTPLAQTIYTPFYSGLADRLGRRTAMLAITLAGSGLAYLLVGLPRTFFGIFAGMVLVALFTSPAQSLSDGLAARMATRHELDYGKMRQWGSIGFAIFSILAGLVWQRTGFAPMFPAVFVAYLGVAFVALLLDELPSVEKQAAPPWREVGRHPVLRTLLIATFLVGGAMMMSINFNGVYMRYLGGGDDLIGLQVGIGAAVEMPFMFFTLRIMRKIGGLNTLLLGYTFFGLSFLGMSLATTPLALLAVTLLRGPGFAMFMITTILLLDRYAGEWSATTQAMMNATAFGIAPLIASPLGGYIFDFLGPPKVFLMSSLLVAAAMVVLYGGLVLFRPAGFTERI